MKRRRLGLWLGAAGVYAVFRHWYTDSKGPLTDAEVDAFVARATDRGDDPDTVAKLERFFREDTGRQFLMVNVVDMNESPPAVEGAPPGADADELMQLYMEHMNKELLKRACHPVVMGEAVHEALDLLGIEGGEEWTGGALFRYRSRRSFMGIIEHPDMASRHRFKLAALDKTIAYPVEPGLNLGDLRLLVGLGLAAGTAVSDAIVANRRNSS